MCVDFDVHTIEGIPFSPLEDRLWVAGVAIGLDCSCQRVEKVVVVGIDVLGMRLLGIEQTDQNTVVRPHLHTACGSAESHAELRLPAQMDVDDDTGTLAGESIGCEV